MSVHGRVPAPGGGGACHGGVDGVGGGWCGGGGHGPRGCMVLGVHGTGGCMVPGGCLVQTPPTATAAGGTHPTGMHSC